MFPISSFSGAFNPYLSYPYHGAAYGHNAPFPMPPRPFPTHLVEPMIGRWGRHAPELNLSDRQAQRLSSVFSKKFQHDFNDSLQLANVSSVRDMDRSGNISVGDIALASRARAIDSTVSPTKPYAITPDVASAYYSRREF
ncbi:hypothetical protein [Thiolinea disciformis]|uniref:hypothetical protein n=1 Tax=Thiolinea disciformis TaxID=125614 RepID=UPI000364E795|nr:hypothetical protein [Thiolinea disciformis]